MEDITMSEWRAACETKSYSSQIFETSLARAINFEQNSNRIV